MEVLSAQNSEKLNEDDDQGHFVDEIAKTCAQIHVATDWSNAVVFLVLVEANPSEGCEAQKVEDKKDVLVLLEALYSLLA